MQLTIVKLDEWFFFGNNKLLKNDTKDTQKILNNLINPAIEKVNAKIESKQNAVETGYKSSEREALENQLLQIESVANAIQKEDK